MEPENEPQIVDTVEQQDVLPLIELLQSAVDGVFPSDQKLEELIDRWEGMP